MHIDRGTVRRYRRSNGIYMIPDRPNNLTCQSAVKNDAPRDHLIDPVTGCDIVSHLT